jgi:restriction system protein
MSVWLVRAGKNGEREDFALENGVAVIGWNDLPDLSNADTREKLSELMATTYPTVGKHALANYVGQVWAFRSKIKEGDLIVLPLKTRSLIAVGKAMGPYKYVKSNPESARHTRPVKWLRDDIPRERFDQDLLYTLGAFLTVCQVERNNAEQRIRAMVEGGAAAGPSVREPHGGEVEAPVDLEQYASDQIRQFIARKFKGHELAQLVAQVLRAEGYQIDVSPPGPDGGVDILAGRGPLGFDNPKLCVQVKSGGSAVDVKVLRELRGVMEGRSAEHGLLVSWSGFTRSAIDEARRQFFRIPLWDAGNLVSEILDKYDKLSEELRAELPLKRVWTLVPEEEDQQSSVSDN